MTNQIMPFKSAKLSNENDPEKKPKKHKNKTNKKNLCLL